MSVEETREIVTRASEAGRQRQTLAETPFGFELVLTPLGDVGVHAQRDDVVREVPEALAQGRFGRVDAVDGERGDGIAELGRLREKLQVPGVRGITAELVTGGKQLRREFAPGIPEPRVELDGAPQRRQCLSAAAAGCVGATELELHERGIGARAGEPLEHRNRRGRIAEPAAGGGEQQLRLGVPRRSSQDVARVAGGSRRVRFEQHRGAHQLEIDRGTHRG